MRGQEEGRAGRGWGGNAGSWGATEELGLLPSGRWKPGRLWAEEVRGLTQVPTGALWFTAGRTSHQPDGSG